MSNTVTVIGAGIVGVSCALELQERGFRVTLVDRVGPGEETSYGNAGVLTRSSLVPFNNPALWKSLPRLIGNRTTQFRYNPFFLARNLPWAIGFLARARRASCDETVNALDALIGLSKPKHVKWLAESGQLHRFHENGWLMLFRSADAYARSRLSRETFERYGLATQTLDSEGLRALEPHLAPIFPAALWIRDAASVDSPGRVVQAYAALFVSRGGTMERREISAIEPADGASWKVTDVTGRASESRQIVVATGPWSKRFLRCLRLSVPMAFERGYHMHYDSAGTAELRRPLYDVSGGYALSPMEQGLRLSTGVELNDLDAPMNLSQLDLAERAAKEAFPLGQRLEGKAWLGSRPTLPDSRPVIGEAPGHKGVWLAFGHQHIGFSTGPGTADCLAAQMCGLEPSIDSAPFRPSRFVS